jgi:hypothetical protein
LARPFYDRLAQGCFGFDAEPGGPIPKEVPRRLAWLRETFGTIDLVAEQSGTAPFGRTFAEVIESELGAHLSSLRSELPADADRWVSLFEINGDWVFADVECNDTVWIGSESTGEAYRRFPVPYSRAASLVLWRLLDGGAVRPVDFEMLVSGMRRLRSR